MKSKIETQVMASVGTIYAARVLMSATALKLYICAISLVGLAKLVWVHRIYENFTNVGFSNAGQFFLSALLNAHTLVQVVLGVLVIAGVSLVIDLARKNTSTNTLAY